MIKLMDIISEVRQGVMRTLSKELVGWPEYVIRDMVYSRIESEKDLVDKLEIIRDLNDQVKGDTWKLHNKMMLKYDMLADRTKEFMEKREFGSKNPFLVPRDKERSDNAERAIREKGIENLPPIIMFRDTGGKLELVEGWHRTMAAFRLYPDGFKVNAWIADVKEDF